MVVKIPNKCHDGVRMIVGALLLAMVIRGADGN